MSLLHDLLSPVPYTTLFRSSSITTLVASSGDSLLAHAMEGLPPCRNDSNPAIWPQILLCPLPMAKQLAAATSRARKRSEEHTSELQSRGHLVCSLLLEKKQR